jgi:hypothetical protein
MTKNKLTLKVFFITSLLLLNGSALAEWTLVSESNRAKHYIDINTYRKNANIGTIWELTNAKQRGTQGELSVRARVEYDCTKERSNYLSISTHSEPDGGGKLLGTVDYSKEDWKNIAPGTVANTIFTIVCPK